MVVSEVQADQLVTFIKTVPVFHSLESDHLFRLADEVTIRDYPSGDTLVTRGDESRELFIMLQGESAAYVTEENVGFERELKRFYPGAHFGMLNILARESSPSTIRAVTDVKTIVISHETIDRLFQESSSFAPAVCRSLASFLSDSIVAVPTIPFKRIDEYREYQSTTKLLPSRISKLVQAIALEKDEDRVIVGIVNPNDSRACDFIKNVLNQYAVEFVAIGEDDFLHHAKTLFPASTATVAPERGFTEFAFVGADGERTPVAESENDALSLALTYAIRAGASDIHVEPAPSGGWIRLRLDGKMLSFQDDIKVEHLRHIISRLKVAAELDITNIRRPQDGRFRIVADGRVIEFRESVIPCEGGEKVVLRVGDSENYVTFDSLFVSDAIAHFAREIFTQPSGLVLVTGPTGSGKTTSLYAALRMIGRENQSSNIVTVEDPIEYGLDFATQTQVDDAIGLGFDSLLRSILRQDPDIILVGEIRDRESAAIAVEAATTGHLVLSSLHTHSAAETLTRLRNLDIPSYLLADALKGVISQKLLPKVHPGSSQGVDSSDAVVRRLIEHGVIDESSLPKLRRGKEVENGPPEGESGRVGMFEILSVTEQMSDLVDRGASRAELSENMEDASFFSFKQYARLLLEGGYVSPERVERVLPTVAKLR